jgi:hypothetical protein
VAVGWMMWWPGEGRSGGWEAKFEECKRMMGVDKYRRCGAVDCEFVDMWRKEKQVLEGEFVVR